MSKPSIPSDPRRWPPRRGDWHTLHQQARTALGRRLRPGTALPPGDVARCVAAALPPVVGRWLLRRFAAHGWLAAEARVPADVLDSAACPREFAGAPREVVRLALFGPGGQGLAWRDRHRHDVYQQLCAEILRSAVDLVSLQNVASRVLNHPDAASDSTLMAWLRAFIAERERALRTIHTPEELHREEEERSKLRSGFRDRADGIPSQREVQGVFSRLQHEFDRHLAQFEEAPAARTLEQMRHLRQKHPSFIAVTDLQQAEEQYDRLLKRAGEYRRQIHSLAIQGAAAARDGNIETANWVMRRLDAIHKLLPTLLPTMRLEQLRTEISQGEAEHEQQETIQELREKEREVAARIKALAGVIHRFHQLAEKLPSSDPAYRRAEANYRQAVDEIRGLDTEWLSGLVLQLETFLDDLDDPGGRMQGQLDTFITNVRTALNRLCLEIRAHQRNHRKGRPPDSAGGTPPPSGV